MIQDWGALVKGCSKSDAIWASFMGSFTILGGLQSPPPFLRLWIICAASNLLHLEQQNTMVVGVANCCTYMYARVYYASPSYTLKSATDFSLAQTTKQLKVVLQTSNHGATDF